MFTCSLAQALHNATGTSYFKKISLCFPNPICFPHVPKAPKAKQPMSLWWATGKALAVKSESLMQHTGLGKRGFLKIKSPLYVLRLLACFRVCSPNTAHQTCCHLGNLAAILSLSASGICRCECGHLAARVNWLVSKVTTLLHR